IVCYFFFFFFQAEDGIRDYKVTGVQTCALPISEARIRFFAVPAAKFNRQRQISFTRRSSSFTSAYSSFWVVRRVSNNARKLAMCSIARKKPASRFSLLGSAASVSSPVRARSNRSVERSSFIHSSRPINFSHDG